MLLSLPRPTPDFTFIAVRSGGCYYTPSPVWFTAPWVVLIAVFCFVLLAFLRMNFEVRNKFEWKLPNVCSSVFVNVTSIRPLEWKAPAPRPPPLQICLIKGFASCNIWSVYLLCKYIKTWFWVKKKKKKKKSFWGWLRWSQELCSESITAGVRFVFHIYSDGFSRSKLEFRFYFVCFALNLGKKHNIPVSHDAECKPVLT